MDLWDAVLSKGQEQAQNVLTKAADNLVGRVQQKSMQLINKAIPEQKIPTSGTVGQSPTVAPPTLNPASSSGNSFGMSPSSSGSSFDMTTLAMIGGVGIAIFFLMRR